MASVMLMSVAPDRLQAIAANLPGAVIALDFDGTLAPIVEDPEMSRPFPGVINTLSSLIDAGAHISVVTGRDALTVLRLGGFRNLRGLTIHGLYGAETWHDGKLVTLEEPSGFAVLKAQLPERLPSGVWLEDKRLSLTLHTRQAVDPGAELSRLREWVPPMARKVGLETHLGKYVLEIRIPGLSKATAVNALLSSSTTAALYAGDDLGDVPAIRAVAQWARRTGRPACTVAVGSLSALLSEVDTWVASPSELADVLRSLLGRGTPS